MNEFWAIVLGSSLATIGGIIGTVFTVLLKKRQEIQNERRSTYIKILNFCNRAKFLSHDKKEFYESLCESLAFAQMYASAKVLNLFTTINMALSELYEHGYEEKHWVEHINKSINNLMFKLVTQIKQELKLTEKSNVFRLKSHKNKK